MLQHRFLLLLLASVMAACGTKAPPPPLKPNAFNRLALLPILENKASSDVAPLSAAAVNRRAANATPGVVVNPATLGMAIGAGLRAANDARYNALSDATSAVQLDVMGAFTSAFNAGTSASPYAFEPLDDDGLAARLRRSDYKQLTTSLEGALDVQIHNVGYYDLGRGRGFAPYIYISARALDLVNPGEVAGEWECTVDAAAPDESNPELRFPADLVLKSVSELGQKADRVRNDFTRVLQFCGSKLAAEVSAFRRAKGSPR